MLMLSRNEGQRIVIGDGKNRVVVLVKDINPKAKKCRLGIEAPPEVPVHRQEVYDAIHREGN
jgi:carbon storage regulator